MILHFKSFAQILTIVMKHPLNMLISNIGNLNLFGEVELLK